MKPICVFVLFAALVPVLSSAEQESLVRPQVYVVPEDIDREIARLKLESMGHRLDKLTAEQEHYLASWQEGT